MSGKEDALNRATIRTWCQLAGLVALFLAAVLMVFAMYQRPYGAKRRSSPITCIHNLKQIGLSFKTWALEHQDSFPFNCPTNAGGTMELSYRGGDGYETNPAPHFQVMSNELFSPRILVCPQDRSKKPAADFSSLKAQNVTYRMRSGGEITDWHPREILVTCPVHGSIVYCDGTVKEVTPEPEPWSAAVIDSLRVDPVFRARLLRALAAALAGCILVFVGRWSNRVPRE